MHNVELMVYIIISITWSYQQCHIILVIHISITLYSYNTIYNVESQYVIRCTEKSEGSFLHAIITDIKHCENIWQICKWHCAVLWSAFLVITESVSGADRVEKCSSVLIWVLLQIDRSRYESEKQDKTRFPFDSSWTDKTLSWHLQACVCQSHLLSVAELVTTQHNAAFFLTRHPNIYISNCTVRYMRFEIIGESKWRQESVWSQLDLMKSRYGLLIFIREGRRGRRAETMRGVEEKMEANRWVVEDNKDRLIWKNR